MIAAELAHRNDQVREVWQKPLNAEPIPVVVVGANPDGRGGEWARHILEATETWDLRAMVDPDQSVRSYWASKNIAAYSELAEVPPGNIKAAVIAVPPRISVEIQKSCFAQQWATLVEKPIAASLSQLMSLHEDFLKLPGKMVPGVQRRSHPSYVALKALLEKHAVRRLSIRITLGKPSDGSLSGHRRNARLCRGGALLDLGYHALDLAHFVLDEPLEMVACSLQNDRNLAKDIESSADVLGRAGKTWVRIQVDRHGKDKREDVFAETAGGVWKADRQSVVDPAGKTVYTCENSWTLAEKGRLSELAVCCMGTPYHHGELWEHFAAFEVIEQAYGLADRLGVREG